MLAVIIHHPYIISKSIAKEATNSTVAEEKQNWDEFYIYKICSKKCVSGHFCHHKFTDEEDTTKR